MAGGNGAGDSIDRAIATVGSLAQTGVRFKVVVDEVTGAHAEIVLPIPVTEVMLFNLFSKMSEWYRKQRAGDGISLPPGNPT